MMIKISGLDLEPIISDALEGDIAKSQSDISLSKRSFGWEHEIRLEDWLKEIL